MLVYVYNCPMIAIVSSFSIAVAVQRHLLQASVEMTVDPSVSEAAGIEAVARHRSLCTRLLDKHWKLCGEIMKT